MYGGKGLDQGVQTHLLFADSAILVASVAHDISVCAGVPSKTRLAGLAEQIEDNQSGDPEHDAEAPRNDAVDVPRAHGAAEGLGEGYRQYGDGGKEIGGSNGEEDQSRGQVGACGPGHGQFALAEVQICVAAVDVKGVGQHDGDAAAEDNDEQAQSRAQAAEPVRLVDGDVGRHADAEAGRLALGVVGVGVGVGLRRGTPGRGEGGGDCVQRRPGGRERRHWVWGADRRLAWSGSHGPRLVDCEWRRRAAINLGHGSAA